jgi:hypothetical protein
MTLMAALCELRWTLRAVGSPDIINGGGSVRIYDWSSGEFSWKSRLLPGIAETSLDSWETRIDLSSNGSWRLVRVVLLVLAGFKSFRVAGEG